MHGEYNGHPNNNVHIEELTRWSGTWATKQLSSEGSLADPESETDLAHEQPSPQPGRGQI